jgi:DNA-binding MarR family transcriptional regulator
MQEFAGTKADARHRPARAKRLRKVDYEVLAAFRRELRRYLAFSERAAETAGLPAQQYQALLAIKGYPGRDRVTVGELARELLIAHHSASELADRLVVKGLLARSTDEGDRRRTLLTLTAEAESVLGGLASTHRDELRRVQPSLLKLLDSFAPDGREQVGARPARAT